MNSRLQTFEPVTSPFLMDLARDPWNLASDLWNPLNVTTPATWRDAIAEDMWQEYHTSVEVVYLVPLTPYERAVRRAGAIGGYATTAS